MSLFMLAVLDCPDLGHGSIPDRHKRCIYSKYGAENLDYVN